MPTKFSEIATKPVSLKEIVKRYARNTQSLGIFADKPLNFKVPKIEASKNDLKALKELEKQLVFFQEKNTVKIKALHKEHLDSVDKEYSEYMNDINGFEGCYKDAIKKINEWKAPSKAHEPLKKFILKDLENTYEFDINFQPKQILSQKNISLKEFTKNRKMYLLNEIRVIKHNIEVLKQRNNWYNELLDSTSLNHKSK